MIRPQSPGTGPSGWPFERPEQLAAALREQDASPAEIADLLPAVQRLAEWQAPQPSPFETQRLLVRLIPELPGFSPVRQAIREHRQQHGSISWLLATARTQISLFGPAFWLVSALITLLGAVAVMNIGALPAQETLLRASGPLLAYLGSIVAFRGIQGQVLECELVCPPSLMQLTIARLVILLGYDLGLGLALGLALWASGTGQVLTLLLSWFMPLLLVAGLALLLSLRLSVQTAASIAYGGWLVILAINATSMLPALLLTPLSDTLMGSIGMVGLAVTLLRLQSNMHRLLPRF
jgi:hypothetical protein